MIDCSRSTPIVTTAASTCQTVGISIRTDPLPLWVKCAPFTRARGTWPANQPKSGVCGKGLGRALITAVSIAGRCMTMPATISNAPAAAQPPMASHVG
jgi:hypothetical protein